MNILMIWEERPSPYSGAALPVFNVLKHLSRSHTIWLLYLDFENIPRYVAFRDRPRLRHDNPLFGCIPKSERTKHLVAAFARFFRYAQIDRRVAFAYLFLDSARELV